MQTAVVATGESGLGLGAPECRLVIVNNPFDCRERDEYPLALGHALTVENLVGKYIPAGLDVRVVINGQAVPTEEWSERIVQAGDQVIVSPEIRDGDSGIIGSIAMIALTVYSGGMASGLYQAMGGTYVMANAGMIVASMQAGISAVGDSLTSSSLEMAVEL